ncbi:MAG: PD40 domain-containing protein [candidate division Zixibacteria bacterium]|nr:PD40 domain-containing protein [candidate division Zixibacteria bacterium]
MKKISLILALAGACLSAHLATTRAQCVQNGRIAYSDTDSVGQVQIFTVNPDGEDRQRLTSLGTNFYPAWSKDGSLIAFTSTRTGSAEIWVMDADGNDQTQLTFETPGENFVPDWSPDGSRIAYASKLDDVGSPEVWVMDSDGGAQQRLTFTTFDSTGFNWSLLPSWSSDGQRIVYASTESGGSQIWIMDADGGAKIQITNGNGPDYPESNAPVWSRDGALIAFWSGFEGQFGEVWVMDSNGSNKRKLTETPDPLSSDNPEWAPDGTALLFDSNRGGPGTVAIWMMDSSGANPTLLAPFAFGSAPGQSSWEPIPNSCITPGDVDDDGDVNIVDVVFIVKMTFAHIIPPCCDQTDADGGGDVNLGDAIFLVRYIFQSGAPPVCPNPGGLVCV